MNFLESEEERLKGEIRETDIGDLVAPNCSTLRKIRDKAVILAEVLGGEFLSFDWTKDACSIYVPQM